MRIRLELIVSLPEEHNFMTSQKYMIREAGSVAMEATSLDNLPEYITGKTWVKWMSISVWRSMVKDVVLRLLDTGRMDVQCSL